MKAKSPVSHARPRIAPLAFILTLAVSTPSQAAPNAPPAGTTTPAPAPATETDVLQAWLRGSREVDSWRTQIGAARFDLVTASLWPNPQLTLGTSYVLGGTPPDGKFNYGPQLTFPLPIFGQIAARKEEAREYLRAAEIEVLRALWERGSDLLDAMVERAFADARAALLQKNIDELAGIQRIVQERAAAGANSAYDVLRVATSENTFQAGRAAALAERNRAESELVALIAASTVTAVPITRTGLLPYAGPLSGEALVQSGMRRRPDLQAAVQGNKAAKATASRWRREVAPIPSVSVGPYFTQDRPSSSIQLSVTIPLPAFDRNQGLIGRALKQAEGQADYAGALRERIRAEILGANRGREAAYQALQAFRTGGLRSTDELLERARVSYQGGGSFQIMDLLDAYRTVWEARDQELELAYALATAEARLARATAALPIPSN